jgi:hypothetical protein
LPQVHELSFKLGFRSIPDGGPLPSDLSEPIGAVAGHGTEDLILGRSGFLGAGHSRARRHTQLVTVSRADPADAVGHEAVQGCVQKWRDEVVAKEKRWARDHSDVVEHDGDK